MKIGRRLRGRFIYGVAGVDGGPIIRPNRLVNEGEEAFLKMLLRGDETIIAGGANFYIGLCNQVPDEADTLVALASEPDATGGYARQPITRDNAGWPSIALSGNGDFVATSAQVDFTAVGADFSGPIIRAFLCSVVDGSVGTLFAISSPLPAPVQIVDGQVFPVRYELYLG